MTIEQEIEEARYYEQMMRINGYIQLADHLENLLSIIKNQAEEIAKLKEGIGLFASVAETNEKLISAQNEQIEELKNALNRATLLLDKYEAMM